MTPATSTHIVDASSVIAYLKGEQGEEILAQLLQDERNALAIHAINLCEVYYNYLRTDGAAMADQAWDAACAVLGLLGLLEPQFVKRVGRWKVSHNLPLGDAVAAATAEEFGCALVTTDHNHFDPVQTALQIVWLR